METRTVLYKRIDGRMTISNDTVVADNCVIQFLTLHSVLYDGLYSSIIFSCSIVVCTVGL